MKALTAIDEPPIRTRIPADLDTPDQLVAGLSARQLALLTAAAVPLYLAWQNLHTRMPVPALTAVTATLAACAVAVVLGRRDGLSLDTWLLAALTYRLRPHRLAPAPQGGTPPLPRWAPADSGAQHRGRGPAVLRLPAEAISTDGVITTGPGTATVLVAASTVTAGLHTPEEQAMLLAGYGRWLNSLTGPVQIVVSARCLDLGARALRVAETAHRLAHPALAAAAVEHAEHLLDLCEDTDRLTRTVTIACTAASPAGTGQAKWTRRDGGRAKPAPGTGDEAARRATRTVEALSALGSRCRVLDGAEVTALLSAAVDPWGPGEASWARTSPGATVTAHPDLIIRPEHVPSRSRSRDDGRDDVSDWDEDDGATGEGWAP
jgi:hypothetical protein